MLATASTVIDAPVEQVWALLDDFARWHDWIPRLESIAMDEGLDQAPVGSTRVVGLPGGKSIRERLLFKDAVRQTLAYTFDGPQPYPVRRYVGTVRVEPVTTTDQTFVNWTADFDADATDEQRAAELFTKTYLGFFDCLAAATATARV